LATQASRILTNSGIDVVSIADNKDNFTKTKIISADKDFNSTLTGHALKLIFDSPLYEIGDTSQQRADMVVFLGIDYWQYFNQRPPR
jgi:hypothetical protein